MFILTNFNILSFQHLCFPIVDNCVDNLCIYNGVGYWKVSLLNNILVGVCWYGFGLRYLSKKRYTNKGDFFGKIFFLFCPRKMFFVCISVGGKKERGIKKIPLHYNVVYFLKLSLVRFSEFNIFRLCKISHYGRRAISCSGNISSAPRAKASSLTS